MNGERSAPQGAAPPPPRGPGLRERLTGIAMERGAGLLSRAESSLPVRCLRRFAAINGRERSLVLGGQAFTALIPLLIVVAAAASGRGPTALADRLAARFNVTGASAQAIRTLFERPPGATGAFTVAGAVVLLFSLLNLTRSLQRTYEAAWHLPAIGVRGTLNGVTAVGLLISSLLVLSLLLGMLRQVPAGTAFAFVLRVVMSTGIWLLLQFLLLSRRVPFRRLLPGSVVAGLGGAALSVYSAVWMPRVIESNSGRYGIIGITFALLTWLILVCVCVVIAAVIGAEMGGAATVGGNRWPAVLFGRAGEAPGPSDDDAL
ncbi:YhjD/YihY/BrkB family envelope integrity protein [Actinoplanes sp. NPDC026623]|uniref:YhjD/YihY/BrkB family envelope integrity protein n=1 Tax=Actinoplanes sp. NPDC026623 TaxID=3155610 RepID=UPI0033FEA24C